jgi:pre-mRNA-splicing helicase BRR2
LTATLKTDQDNKDVSKALDSIQVKSDEVKMDVDDAQHEEKVMELDLDQLAFREGSHTMSNKKCDLPDTSWRAMKKGYEEVHVPAIKSVIPKDEKLVKISELPEWTQKAFKNMEKLNRVQSKMYEVALKSSENLLLCAPTGAGKVSRWYWKHVTHRTFFLSRRFPFLCSDKCSFLNNAQYFGSVSPGAGSWY